MRVDGLILAAGLSSRMVDNKLLLAYKDSTIIRHIATEVLKSNLGKVVLVTGRDADEIKNALMGLSLDYVHNKDFRLGQSTSVSLGVKQLKDSQAIMFLMGDQPLIRSDIINDMIETFVSSGKSILVPYHDKERGNPVIFGSMWFENLIDLSGDYGGRYIIKEHPEHIKKYSIKEEHFFLDVDTKENYKMLLDFDKSSV